MLVVASPDDNHLKNIEAQREILEALIGSLANYMEAPLGDRAHIGGEGWVFEVDPTWSEDELIRRLKRYRAASMAHKDVVDAMARVAARLGEDTMMLPRDLTMFSALSEQLTTLQQRESTLLGEMNEDATRGALVKRDYRRLTRVAVETEGALEKGILRLEDLLLSQQMASAQQTAAQARDLKEKLRELLTRYKETGDPALKEAIRREIQRLRQRMSELMQRMSQQMQSLPQEHVNRDALEQARLESDAKQLADSFQDIERMLDQDDIDGALEALDKMTESLDDMTKEMDSQFDRAQPEGLSEFDKKVSELMDDVNDLSQLQREVESQTRAMQDAQRAERSKQLEGMLKDHLDKMLRQIARQERDFEALDENADLAPHLRSVTDRARDKLADLKNALEQRDIEGGLESARSHLSELESLRYSMRLSTRFRDAGDSKARAARAAMERTRDMMDRGEEISDQLRELMNEASKADEQGRSKSQELAKKQQQVAEQAQKLNQKIEEASEQFPMLDSKLKPSMKRASESMGEAEQGLKKGRMQRALDAERQALRELDQAKDGMKQALQKQRQQEQKNNPGIQQRREQVEIPGASQEAPGRLRDAIKKTMKEERLDDYSSEIERYYETLAR